jgi:ribosomal protein S18 acetylase RimI-like enzyme
MTALVQPHAEGYDFVPARSVQTARLVAFAAAVWPDRPHDQLVARWWRRAEPGCAVAAIHRASGAMAGFCSARPSDWLIDGKSVPTIAICDWYVDPAHAGKGIGKCLTQHLELADQFVYTFSLSEAAIANFKKLGWAGPRRASLMVLPLPQVTRLGAALFGRQTAIEIEDAVVSPESPALAALGPQLDRIEERRLSDGGARMQRGAAEWRWRLSVCGPRSYHFCLARRAGEPVGYAVVRRLTPGSSRQLGRIPGAMLTDLVAVRDEPAVLQALASRAAAVASKLGTAIVLAVTNQPGLQLALGKAGFLSPNTPLLGRALLLRSPHYMWVPKGPGAPMTAEKMGLTFADSDVDLLL